MATTAFIYLFFSSLGSLPRPRWVVGHLLLVRGQQAAICWPAGPQRIGKAGGGGGTPPARPSFSSRWQGQQRLCTFSRGCLFTGCAANWVPFSLRREF